MKILIALLINLTMFAGIAFAGLANHNVSPIFRIFPDQPLMDQAVNIRLSGLPPQLPVTIRATMLLAQYTWHSHASFVADRHGNIDLGKLAPMGGSYSGVDPMGLFRSMTPDAAQSSTRKNGEANSLDPVVTNFVAEIEGRPVASVNLTRLWTKPGIRITDIRENGLVGKLFEPQTKGRHPCVLVLSGSEGG